MVVLSHLCLLLGAASAAGVVRRYSELEGRPYSIARDGRSLLVNGSRVLLLSGSIHYPRSTPAMWPKLFAEARANGLNAIESYAFWNKHSATRDGAYDYGFNGDVDLFLSLAAEHDLFVLWRFGPYVCAEWPAGGIPARAPRRAAFASNVGAPDRSAGLDQGRARHEDADEQHRVAQRDGPVDAGPLRRHRAPPLAQRRVKPRPARGRAATRRPQAARSSRRRSRTSTAVPSPTRPPSPTSTRSTRSRTPSPRSSSG